MRFTYNPKQRQAKKEKESVSDMVMSLADQTNLWSTKVWQEIPSNFARSTTEFALFLFWGEFPTKLSNSFFLGGEGTCFLQLKLSFLCYFVHLFDRKPGYLR